MTLLTARTRLAAVSRSLVASWNVAATWWHPLGVIVLAWAVLVLPLVFFRGYNSDEGLTVSIARTAVETGHWLTPYLFNTRWVERPTLLSWIIAAFSAPFGTVSQVTARLPIALFLLLGCLLIYALLRKVAASVPASLFGVALFLACPLVIRAYVMVTADLPLAVLLFLAVVVWWSGYADGAVGILRWMAIGVVLALAGLMKGPEPIAYFALGVGIFLLASRSWRQILGLMVAGLICVVPLAAWYAAVYVPGVGEQWSSFMRLQPLVRLPGPLVTSFKVFKEMLPALLMAAAFLIWQGFRDNRTKQRSFIGALSCYAFIASIVVLFWPGGATPRYFFPMLLPLCVLGGLGYDALSVRGAQIVVPIMVLMAAMLSYALAYSAVSPFMPNLFRRSRLEASQITALVGAAPAPIYTVTGTALNVLPYLPGPIFNTAVASLPTMPAPAWMVVTPDLAARVLAQRPAASRVALPPTPWHDWELLRIDE
jgi:4-amino-4-deoxy-L-arabinose transferase-like glycosyltransferase